MRDSPFDLVIRGLAFAERAFLALLGACVALTVCISAYLSLASDKRELVIPGLWSALTFVLAALFAIAFVTRAVLTGDLLIISKQMRQRALGTTLTLLSVLLGVALAVAVLLLRRESGQLFGQTDFGYEVIVGPPKGSDLALTLNTVYQLGASQGNVPYALYEQMSRKGSEYGPLVRQAIPILVGDNYRGNRIVGTSPQLFGVDDAGKPVASKWEYRSKRSYEMAEGRPFLPARFEAVIGSDVARAQHMAVGSKFKATHGLSLPAPGEKPDEHRPEWTVVGVLQPTQTANDRTLFVPVVSLYAIEEHSYGLIAQAMIKAGVDPNRVPPAQLPDILRKLGFNPDDLPKSVMHKFNVGAAPAAPASRPADDAGGGELLKPVAPPKPAAAPAGGGGELLRDQPKEPPSPAVAVGAELPGDKPAGEPGKAGDDEEADAYHLDADGNIVPDLPKDEWEISAILVKTRGAFQAQSLIYRFRVANPDAMAVNPASTMREFFDTFLKGSTVVLLVLAALVSVVAAISILVSIYNSVAARQRDIAILRALGATRGRVVGLICLEAALIGLIGGVGGIVAGHAVGGVGSIFFRRVIGESINWLEVGSGELLYLVAVLVIAVLAGLVPAVKAYRVPVATNLVGG